MKQNRSIKSWHVAERPREKLTEKGTDFLSDSELVSILIRNGSADANALDVSKELLSKVDYDLNRLSRFSVQGLVNLKIKGLGLVKCLTILAALELGTRREAAHHAKIKITSTIEVAGYLKANFQHLNREVFIVIFLNRANVILHTEVVSQGGVASTVVDPRIIFKKALEYNAVGLILAHNHPSGNLTPSQQDKDITYKLQEGGAALDIQILDHIIVSDTGYFSFLNANLLF